MQSITSSVPRSLFAMTCLLALAGTTAGAQQAAPDTIEPDRIEGNFDDRIDQPARGQRVPRGTSSFTIANSWTHAGKTYTVTNRNGNVTVEVDGQPLAANRWRQRDNTIQVLDEQGNVLTSTDLPRMTGDNNAFRLRVAPQGDPFGDIRQQLRDLELRMTPRAQGEFYAPARQRPPVMLGINMSPLEDGDGVRVDRVLDDLPAHKAGLREGDIIIKIGDRPVAQTTDIVTFMQERKPGDKVDLIVRRDDQERTLTVELAPYDAQSIEQPPILDDIPLLDAMPQFDVLRPSTDNSAKVREQLESLANALRDKAATLEKADAQTVRDEARKALQDAVSQLDEARAQLDAARGQLEELRRFRLGVAPDGDGRRMFILPDNDARAPQPPRPPQPPTASDDLRTLRDELRQLREEVKELRQKNEQPQPNNP